MGIGSNTTMSLYFFAFPMFHQQKEPLVATLRESFWTPKINITTQNRHKRNNFQKIQNIHF